MDFTSCSKSLLLFLMVSSVFSTEAVGQVTTKGSELAPGARKVKDIVIYEDDQYYSSFPSIARLPDGDLFLAFRRAPDRSIFAEQSTNHVDPNSYLVSLRTKDHDNWPEHPELLYAHPFGGSQDPCILPLPDGSLLCTSYAWSFVRSDGLSNLKQPFLEVGNSAVFLGGYTLLSKDAGESWEGPYYPPHLKKEIYFNSIGKGAPAYNRGAPYVGDSGIIYWIVAVHDEVGRTSNHLITSADQGVNWDYVSTVASDTSISFNEASLHQTPKGDLVGFIRTAGMEDQAVIARSSNGGKTFSWESMGFQGHPLNALKLPDDRVLLTYGYRHEPFGIRARILNSECTNYDQVPELILRDDGGNRDIGYSWPVLLDDNRVLVVYYFNLENGTRHIAGTILEID